MKESIAFASAQTKNTQNPAIQPPFDQAAGSLDRYEMGSLILSTNPNL